MAQDLPRSLVESIATLRQQYGLLAFYPLNARFVLLYRDTRVLRYMCAHFIKNCALGKWDLALGEQCGSVAPFTKETSLTASGIPCFGKGTNAKLDSSVDCRATATALARNDRKNSPCEKLDSSTNAPSPSSRADEIGVAIHNSAPAESNAINNAHKVRNLESVQGVWGFKGDKGERFASSPPVPLEKSLSQVTPESSDNTQKVESMDCRATATALARNDRKNSPCEKLDSSTNAPSPSSRADEIGVAIHNTKADSREMQVKTMDCHEKSSDFSRNDKNSNNALDCYADKSARNDKKVDSGITKETSPSQKPAPQEAPPIILAQSDTTAGFLCQVASVLNRAKHRPSDKPVLQTFASLQCAKREHRLPRIHRHFIRHASKSSIILPSKKSFRVVKEPLHREFLSYFGRLYSTSANRSKEPFSLDFALQVADIIALDSRGLYEDKPSAIYKLSRTRKRRVR